MRDLIEAAELLKSHCSKVKECNICLFETSKEEGCILQSIPDEWELPKIKPKPSQNFGPNGPTGHGDICHSDADQGL